MSGHIQTVSFSVGTGQVTVNKVDKVLNGGRILEAFLNSSKFSL